MVEESHTSASAGRQAQGADAAEQQAAAGPPDGDKQEAPDTVSRAELEKVIGERQAAKQRARAAENKLAEIQEKLKDSPTAEELEQFKAWKTRLPARQAGRKGDEVIEAGEADGPEGAAREPLEAEVKSLKESNEGYRSQLTALLRDSELRKAAEEAGAHNPAQVVMLLRHRVRVQERDGRFVPEFLDDQGEPLYDAGARRVADAETFVNMFLAQPENANLIRATARPGSGAKPPGGPVRQADGIPATLEAFNTLPAEKRRQVALKMTPQQMHELLGAQSPGTRGFFQH